MTSSVCKGILRDVSLAELPRPNREPGFYLEHRERDAWTQALFIEAVREGVDKSEAAREAGTTATKMKALRKRDSAFRQLYDEAVDSYNEALEDRVRAQWHQRAFDKSDSQSARLLERLTEALLPEMAYKRTKHVTHDNPLQVQAIPFIDPTKLDEKPLEWRERLLADLEEVTASGHPKPSNVRALDAG